MVLGKGPLADMMKVVSECAKLSEIYTNHCIRKTAGTAMHKSGASLRETRHLMKQKNIQSLQHYVAGPTLEDKERYGNMLYNYTKPKEVSTNAAKNDLNKENDAQVTIVKDKMASNVNKENAVVPLLNQISMKVLIAA